MARISNETLGKVMATSADSLETTIRKDAKERKKHEKLISEDRRAILHATSNLKVDTKPLDAIMTKSTQKIDKVMSSHAREIEKKAKDASLTWKAIVIYFGSLTALCLFFYFVIDKQQNKIDDAKEEVRELKTFIQADEKRTADFREWEL